MKVLTMEFLVYIIFLAVGYVSGRPAVDLFDETTMDGALRKAAKNGKFIRWTTC